MLHSHSRPHTAKPPSLIGSTFVMRYVTPITSACLLDGGSALVNSRTDRKNLNMTVE
jgi:hypothetical protein